MTNIVALYFSKHRDREEHGERDFWREWGPIYVRRLFAGVDRHMPKMTLYRKYLITDTPAVAPPGVITVPLPTDLDTAPGWWMKLGLFAGRFWGKTLYLDLDNVVSGDLGPLLALEPDPLLMLDDRVHPGLPNGAALLCYPERLRFLWDEYLAAPALTRQAFSEWPHASDQAFIAHQIRRTLGHTPPFMQPLLPPGYILNARAELEAGCDWSSCALVYGSYHPKPHESIHPFYDLHWRG